MRHNKITKSLEVRCKNGEWIQRMFSDQFLMVTPLTGHQLQLKLDVGNYW
jgi:hypothetical protein